MNEKKTSLVEWTAQISEIMEEISSYEDGKEEIPQALLDRLSDTLTNTAEKVDRCASFVLKSESDIEWLNKEKATIDKMIKRRQNAIKRMKYLAGTVMDANKSRKIEGMLGHSFAKRETSFVEIEDKTKIPDKYLIHKTSTQIDKAKIKADLGLGQEIPGATLNKRDSIIVK